ncbi:hypothetical protein N665_0679s0002 [Sinapis alba]|nr:hypothetical protein N665_0679s0002 [Sinapis alba]
MLIKILLFVFSTLIIFTRPKNLSLSFPTKITPIISPIPPLTSQPPAFESSLPCVPAFFVFGDSFVDFGTNNFLGTLSRVDQLPYSRDFDKHQPTGRFNNGRILVDFLGLPLVPSYLGQYGPVEDMFQDVNFASAGVGQRVSFAMQIKQFVDTFQQMKLSIGEEALNRRVSTSYIHFHIINISNVQNLYPMWLFNQFLAFNMRQELKTLYDVKVRRLVVMGLPPIGCAPYYLQNYMSQNGECTKDVNRKIMESNFVMRYTIDQLNLRFQTFNETMEACCGLGRYKGWLPCILPKMACFDAADHLWWDQFHSTDAVYAILADNVWNGGRHIDMCYQSNLETMLHG